MMVFWRDFLPPRWGEPLPYSKKVVVWLAAEVDGYEGSDAAPTELL